MMIEYLMANNCNFTGGAMRKYFPELFGNDFHKNRIGASILEDRLPHAILIDGPEGSGKKTFALMIAAALNCEMKDSQDSALPCGRCNSCRRITEGSFTDVKMLEKPADKSTIGVNAVKDFRSDMYLSATESGYKVYIIDGAENMTTEAQNALLIILEEPPKNVVIMLLASGTDSILTTIKSRTQYIAMSRFTSDELDRYVSGKNAEARRLAVMDEHAYRSLLVSADGRIGRLEALLNPKTREENEERRDEIIAIIRALSDGSRYTNLYEAFAALPTKRTEFREALELLITALGDLIASKKADNFTPSFFADSEEARQMAEGISLKKLIKIYDATASTQAECLKNINVTLAATNLAVQMKLA